MPHITRNDLRAFISPMSDFYQNDPKSQCVAFSYFIQEIKQDPVIDLSDMISCYANLDLPLPDDVSGILSKLAVDNILLEREPGIYRLSAIVCDKIQKEYGYVPIDSPSSDIDSSSGNVNEDLSKFLILHRKISDASRKLFLNGHYSQAIFEGVKVLELEIKSKSGVQDKIGVDPANHVFSETNPILKIVEGTNIEHVDEREGFRFLLMGVFRGIKNPQSHSMQELTDPTKALEYLAFLSILLKRVHESKK